MNIIAGVIIDIGVHCIYPCVQLWEIRHLTVTNFPTVLEILNFLIICFVNRENLEGELVLYNTKSLALTLWLKWLDLVQSELHYRAVYSVTVFRAPDITPHSITCWHSVLSLGSETTSSSVPFASVSKRAVTWQKKKATSCNCLLNSKLGWCDRLQQNLWHRLINYYRQKKQNQTLE